MNKLLVVLFALGAILCLADAVSKEQVLKIVWDIAFTKELEETDRLEEMYGVSMRKAVAYNQRSCLRKEIGNVLKDFTAMGAGRNKLMDSYTATPADRLARLNEEEVVKEVKRQVQAYMPDVEGSIVKMKQCLLLPPEKK